jgi:NADH-quinone oxidoreductase subunit I
MYGLGVLKSLGVVLKHFFETYLEDFRWWRMGKRRYFRRKGKEIIPSEEGIASRSSKNARGIFTIQYPEEKLPIPEEFRFIPFLIYEEKDGIQEERCTSCGICAKVCPPQCIWIVRTNDPNTGRPVPQPAEFYIDVDICMSCGFCAEYCPFDAIKMDHDYEIAVYDRKPTNIYNKQKLLKSLDYYASIRPENYRREETARAEAEAAKAAKRGQAARP